jgi:hypothetical protein
MTPDFGAVNPDGCVVVDCLKVKKELSVSPALRNLHRASVPDSIEIVGVCYPGLV